MPNLDFKGKIIFSDQDNLSLCSSGSGSFLKSLGRDGLLKIMEASKIEYLNIVGTKNLTARLCDPMSLGFLEQQGLDVTFETFRRESLNITHPTILEDEKGFLDLYYPEQSLRASQQNDSLFPKYGVVDVNMFTTLEYVKKTIKFKSAEAFMFRLKRKKISAWRKEIKTNFEDTEDFQPNGFSFELNAFNLVKLTQKVNMLIRDADKEAVLFPGKRGDAFNEQLLMNKLKQAYDKFCILMTGSNPSKLSAQLFYFS